ncbi:LexA family protein, partial [Clostridium butyricum]
DKSNVQDIFRLPIDFVKHDRELFMIKVADNSMMDTGINKNDLAIMEKTNTINNGEIALIFVNENTIIRRCFFENNNIRLKLENNEFNDVELNQCKILGRLIGIYRAL